MKRLIDIILSSVILLLLCIPMIIIYVLIRLESKGPVIFKQLRYGLNQNKIIVWKFRTMRYSKDASFVQATANDNRVTKFGRILRKLSFDEFPQFINVLQGRMSIVGPRPHPIELDDQYKKKIYNFMDRYNIKPGITGWAQINGWRGETDQLYKMEKRFQYDIEYIKKQSLYLDLKIIFITIFKVFFNKNAF